MDFIIEFYKELDTLNLIIFWGIIIVIILLLIFSFILLNKNKKLKSLVYEKNNQDELPIKKEIEIPINKIKEENPKEEIIENTVNIEIKEKVEEPVKEEQSVEQVKTNIIQEESKQVREEFQMPTAPYQRNVLREMSLSQTSPIGINKREEYYDKNIEMAKDLEESFQEESTVVEEKESQKVTEEIKKDLSGIENPPLRKTEIRQVSLLEEEPKEEKNKPSNNQYLEEVSKKLSEAEVTNEIERTNYEIKQEEDAIISYKELMEKKDSIQTIDEEDAIISIEELMNIGKQKEEKLYNLTENEKNDDFIKELKQFRQDL